MRYAILGLTVCLWAGVAWAQEETPPDQAPVVEAPMTMARLGAIVKALDPEAVARGPAIEFTLDGIPILLIADPRADRMRAMVPIASAEGLDEEDLRRLMQANFDAALDARYAVANGRLWGVFIHPLSPLEKDQLLSGLVQTITVARTYGTAYTSGGAVFGGGDSNRIYRDLLEELRKKGEAL
ncbi:MAG: hypothetical protein P1U53_08050 [Sulfitobacter sp.]|nr:hypothetical protein [Sulfitobacter sp.]